MEQKTEASQAVERRAEYDAFCEWVRETPGKPFSDMAWEAWQDGRARLRAALKAQPAPTEAANPDLGIRRSVQGDAVIPASVETKGEDSARLDAAHDVLAERRRQIEAEGWTPERDDEYKFGELAKAAICYVRGNRYLGAIDKPIDTWPFNHGWWKPTTDRRNLVKAGALIIAEIERIDRARASAETGGVKP